MSWHPDDAYDATALQREEAAVLTEVEVLGRLRAAVAEAGGQRAFARLHDMSSGLVCDVLKRRKPAPPAILAALGARWAIISETRQ